MSFAYISSSESHLHDTGEDHPENARRIAAIEDQMVYSGLIDVVSRFDAPEVTRSQLLRVHTSDHIETLDKSAPKDGYLCLDPDTVTSPGSLQAARRAAGAAVMAVDLVMSGEMQSAFCCVRPPGHHAESNRAMGFCLYNNIAVAAAHALEQHGLKKVAIVDFDVHQGNGTEEIFKNDERVLFCSTFQYPFYPFVPPLPDSANRVNVALDASARGDDFRAAVSDRWLPALAKFEPELVLVSAGFDAHHDDAMSYVSLKDVDFRWVMEQIVAVAANTASGTTSAAFARQTARTWRPARTWLPAQPDRARGDWPCTCRLIVLAPTND